MSVVAPRSLDRLTSPGEDALYPCRVLEGMRTALVLFAGAFYGRQDAVWVARAGLRATCVDVRAEGLDAMQAIYPADWEFAQADAYAYARTWRAAGRQWDIVSVDCPSGQFDRAADEAQLWCGVARRAVVVGSGARELVAPAGWKVTGRVERSSFLEGGVWWTVMEPGWC